MTRKLVQFNVCDICGKEVRDPDLSSAVFVALAVNNKEDTESGTFPGKRMDLCEDCRNASKLLHVFKAMEAGEGFVTFKPDITAKPKKQKSGEVSCPLCGFGPRGRQSISVHMGRAHRNDKRYSEARREIWPDSKIGKKKTRAKRRPVAVSNLPFLSPEQQLSVETA